MKKAHLWFVPALVAALLLSVPAHSQTSTFTSFVNSSPSASLPLGATDYFAVTQGSVTKKLPGSTVVLTSGSQTVSGKTMSGSSNTFTNIPLGSAVTGTLIVGHGGTGITTGTSGGILYFSATGTMASSAALTANRIVLGGGAGSAPTVLGAGTSTTILHGNASGAPTFGAVDLTAEVTGILPGANGGTGNGFVAFSGPASSLKTFALPNASATILTTNAAVTVAQGGTGAATLTGLVVGNGTSPMSAYAGATCTNQFIRSLSAAGAATCASVANTDLTNSSVTVNGTSIALGASGTVTAEAGTLTGSTLASGVTASSLTSLGTLTALNVAGNDSGSVLQLATVRNTANPASSGYGAAIFGCNSTTGDSPNKCAGIAGVAGSNFSNQTDLAFYTDASASGGAPSEKMRLYGTGGLALGSPTGGDKGAGTLNIANEYYANGTVGVSCAANTVTLLTEIVTNGIVTHC